MNRIHTLGHGLLPWPRFIGLLQNNGITAVVDVRSQPYSRRAPQYRKKSLARALENAGLTYHFMGDRLGGRPADPAWYDQDGRPDGAKWASRPAFLEGIERLVSLAAGRNAALVCAEEDPGRCHRSRWIEPALAARGWRIVHIRADGRLETSGPKTLRL
jgi:uncharacterized protein (DUF488 family)